jgi:hypothetical protein
MKGQIFILASVMILIALLLLQNAIRPVDARSKSYLIENFANIKGEMIRTVDISLLNGEGIPANLDSFIAFSKGVMGSRGYEEDATYSLSTFGNTTTVYMNLTLSLGSSYIEDNFIINRTVYS